MQGRPQIKGEDLVDLLLQSVPDGLHSHNVVEQLGELQLVLISRGWRVNAVEREYLT